MNPSASGWILKYFLNDLQTFRNYALCNDDEFYFTLKNIGFIYGTNVNYITSVNNNEIKLTQEELAKVNLLASLVMVYFKYNVKSDASSCIKTILEFYNTFNTHNKNYFTLSFIKSSPENQLESTIQNRIQTRDNFIQKNFSNIVTNALLFIDVLSFKRYLIKDQDPRIYSSSLEKVIVNIIYITLNKKELKGKYDKMIIKLIQSSLRYYTINENEFRTIEALDLNFLTDEIEKQYILDLACMITYTDKKIDTTEKLFVNKLVKLLKLDKVRLKESIKFLEEFVLYNKKEIYYFKISNPLKYFYDNTFRSVSVLLRRNKKRIIKEISESKELMQLLLISNTRELSAEEKTKVKTQLLDILKSIPSLAIFALPGGSLLLPIIIKMIPNILPSSFNENNTN